MYLGSTTSAPMNDAQLREWALHLHATSVAPAKLSGFGIEPEMLLKTQLDDQALTEVRRWSGITHPTQNTLEFMMTEQKFADFLPASHVEAMRLLTDGLCRIREAALVAPEHAVQVADVMHNIPGILVGEDRAGESYLTELLEKGRALIDDNTWRRA